MHKLFAELKIFDNALFGENNTEDIQSYDANVC